MRRISLLVAGTILASCTTAPPPPEGPTPREVQNFQELTAGKVAEAPVGCIAYHNANDMRVVDGRTLGFRVGGGNSRVYIAHLSPGCEQITHGTYALLNRQFGSSGVCRGDIQQVVDTTTRVNVGSCVIADIVPYARH